jgi:O-acetyl-ADP-ribose deacetylase (regulator of RNase III)
MIRTMRGNVIEADAEALVNTVNCEGYMGKGIALQFKKAFPENNAAYERDCRAGNMKPGRMFIFETGSMVNPKYIINFPTKRHWRDKSRLDDIEAGLKALVEEIRQRRIRSVAIPPLGCGLGGLRWTSVRPRIEHALASVPDVQTMLYEPAGTPDAEKMPVRTKRPRMTVARALFISLIAQYRDQAYRLTLLEIQKLAYFLQESGEPLRLQYEEGLYGPYAHNLNKVLEIMEGHLIRGYGDSQKPDVEIELLPGAIEVAEQILARYEEPRMRLRRVSGLIEGFETPYGMELLASAHWVAVHSEPPARGADEAVRAIHNWNDRKRAMFQTDHIHVAWVRLLEQGWLKEHD